MLGAKLGISSKQYNIVTDGLVVNYVPGFLNSYPGSGTTVTNINGAGPNGTLGGGTAYTATSGNAGGKFTFDGTDDKITAADDAALDVTAVTLQCWAYLLSGDTGANWTIIGRPGGASSRYKIRASSSDSVILMQIYDSTYRQGPSLNISSDSLQDNWNFLSFSYDYNASDGQRFKVYLNGVLDSQSTTGGGTIATDTVGLEFMTSTADSSFKAGYLGPCMIYDRELTAGEILQNYNATKDRYTN